MAGLPKTEQATKSLSGVRKAFSHSPRGVGKVVAQHVVPGSDNTDCVWNEDEGITTLRITYQVGEQTVTRTYKIESRPLACLRCGMNRREPDGEEA